MGSVTIVTKRMEGNRSLARIARGGSNSPSPVGSGNTSIDNSPRSSSPVNVVGNCEALGNATTNNGEENGVVSEGDITVTYLTSHDINPDKMKRSFACKTVAMSSRY